MNNFSQGYFQQPFNNQGYSQNMMPMQPQAQMPMQMQVNQLRTLLGRIINDISEVNPNEVPQYGQFGIYPTNDLKRIYIKHWSNDGTQIITNCYTINSNANASSSDETLINILDRLDQLEKKVGGLHE